MYTLIFGYFWLAFDAGRHAVQAYVSRQAIRAVAESAEDAARERVIHDERPAHAAAAAAEIELVRHDQPW